MTVENIANRLVELCRVNKWTTAYEELFAQDAKAFEMEGVPEREMQGLENLFNKTKAHTDNWETVHEIVVTDPLVFGTFFSVGMKIDTTNKEGIRVAAEEMCLYEVKDGKIIAERFFYTM